MTLASIPRSGVAGDQPVDLSRTGNLTGPSSSRRVSPSLQLTGRVYFSECTLTTVTRNAPTSHSTALAICGEPVTRPPISSVRRRRFSSIGEGPMTIGSSFAATCAQLDASVAEQPAATGFCPGPRGFLTGGSCALAGNSATAKKTRNKMVHGRARVGCRRRADNVREPRGSQELALPRPQLCREPPLSNTDCCFINLAPP